MIDPNELRGKGSVIVTQATSRMGDGIKAMYMGVWLEQHYLWRNDRIVASLQQAWEWVNLWKRWQHRDRTMGMMVTRCPHVM